MEFRILTQQGRKTERRSQRAAAIRTIRSAAYRISHTRCKRKPLNFPCAAPPVLGEAGSRDPADCGRQGTRRLDPECIRDGVQHAAAPLPDSDSPARFRGSAGLSEFVTAIEIDMTYRTT